MTATRRPRFMVIDPGASWSTADVHAGLCHGLRAHGVEVIEYLLSERIANAGEYLHITWRRRQRMEARAAKRDGRPKKDIPKPSEAEVQYTASFFAEEAALRKRVDAVIVVSSMFLHPQVIVNLVEAKKPIFGLFTESPYDIGMELTRAPLFDGGWTNERSSVKDFNAVKPDRYGYLPHAWHPKRHLVGPQPEDESVPAHDVVFVGSAFRERVEFLEAIDWTGIDLGLYGSWDEISETSKLRQFIRGAQITNTHAAALYRRAKVGLNLYRQSMGWGRDAPLIDHAESLNPRAYELAACGAFHLSDFRAEVSEVFGDLVPTFRTPIEAAALIRRWLSNDSRRREVAESLPACVAESSWVQRARTVIGDIESLLHWQIAGGHTGGQISRQERASDVVDDGIHGSRRAHDERVDAEPRDGSRRGDVVRGRQQNLCAGAAGSAGHPGRVR